MTYKILYLAFRKAGTTPADFRAHYEEKHMPVIKTMAGEHFPLSHVRYYIHRTSTTTPGAGDTERNTYNPATVLMGSQADFEYDAFVEMTFEDEKAFQTFVNILRQPENAKWIAEDEERFLDLEKKPTAVLGDVVTMER